MLFEVVLLLCCLLFGGIVLLFCVYLVVVVSWSYVGLLVHFDLWILVIGLQCCGLIESDRLFEDLLVMVVDYVAEIRWV